MRTASALLVVFLLGCDPKGAPWFDFGGPYGDAPNVRVTPGIDSGSHLDDARPSEPIRDDAGWKADGGSTYDAGLEPDATPSPDAAPKIPEAGSPPVAVPVDACVPVTHTNGLGRTWSDCTPLGVWNEAQASRACTASFGGCGRRDPGMPCEGVSAIGAELAGQFYLWVYDAPANAGARVGDVRVGGTSTERCPNWGTQVAVWR